MSKYNRMISFDPRTMSDDEFSIAAHEWAEGSASLENLLWRCRDFGIITSGSHVGSDNAYIDFDIDASTSPRQQIEQMLSSLTRFRNTQVLFATDGYNPRSGPRWHVPKILVDVTHERCPDVLFDQLIYALEHPTAHEETPFSAMLKLYDVLANCRAFMDVRLQKSRGTTYSLSFEFWEGPRTKYLEDYFKHFGFTKTYYTPDCTGPIVMLAKTSDAQTATTKINALASKIASTFAPPKEFNHNRFNEKAIHVLDTKGIDVVNAYIEQNRHIHN